MTPRKDRPRPVFLFDLDGTLLKERTIVRLSEEFGFRRELEAIWETHRSSQELAAGEDETAKVASLLEDIPTDRFRRAIEGVPFREGARAMVDRLREVGFRLGVASASYQEATDRARRELGMDLSVGVRLEREDHVLTGEIASDRIGGPCGQWICKERVLRSWKEDVGAPYALALGDGLNDVCMMREADLGLALEPCPESLKEVADRTVPDLRSVPVEVSEFLEEDALPRGREP